MRVALVENPRKRRRRKLSAAQRAAGFGGKRSMGRRKKRPYASRAKKRRNPGLTAALGNPRRYHRRRRRNPAFRLPGLGAIDLTGALGTGAGILVGAKIAPLARRFGLPIPAGTVWDSISAALFGLIGARLLRGVLPRRYADSIANGAIAYAAYNMLDVYVAPMVGLSGVRGYRRETMSGYVSKGDVTKLLSAAGKGISARPMLPMNRRAILAY